MLPTLTADVPPRRTPPDAFLPSPVSAGSTVHVADPTDSSTALLDPTSGGPVYPPALLAQGVAGEALVEFVVDTTGRVDTASFLVVDATDPRFADAVRDALPAMRFAPARVGGHRRRQAVQLPVRFAPSRAPGTHQ
ncbi:MAG TPA: TonB family protein [Gemmatirosa sp.]